MQLFTEIESTVIHCLTQDEILGSLFRRIDGENATEQSWIQQKKQDWTKCSILFLVRKCAPCRSCRLERPGFVRCWVGWSLRLAGFMPYSDKIQKDKSISKRICSYLVREWGMLIPSRLLFTAVIKFSFGWRLSLDDFLHCQANLVQITVWLFYAYGLEVVKYICICVERNLDVRMSHQVL